MNAAVIRYQTRPEAADENQRLIEDVFAELAAWRHPACTTALSGSPTASPSSTWSTARACPELAAFQEFQRGLGDRLAVGPARDAATLIGSYPPDGRSANGCSKGPAVSRVNPDGASGSLSRFPVTAHRSARRAVALPDAQGRLVARGPCDG